MNLSNTSNEIIISTIISINRIATLRPLLESIQQQGIQAKLVTCIVDEQIEEYIDPNAELSEIVLSKDLNIPNWQHFAFKFDILELNTAVKPYFLEYLFDNYDAQKVIYLDSDIIVYHNFDELIALMDDYMSILVPHILQPLDDDKNPSEVDIMRAGTYNLGFFAISRRGAWREALQWWQRRLYEYCYSDIQNGIFVDQKWMDLLPSFFEDVYILRDPGYDVAYWNMSERELSIDEDGKYFVNGRPLIFFHFSGVDMNDIEKVSKHQNRFRLSNLNEAYNRIFREYQATLERHDMDTTVKWPYFYNTFEDGVSIPKWLRRVLRHYDPMGTIWENPFDISGTEPFREWASQPISESQILSPVALIMHDIEPFVRSLFPNLEDPMTAHSYAHWFIGQSIEGTIDEFYTRPVKEKITNASPPQPEQQQPNTIQHSTTSAGWLGSRVEYFAKHPMELPKAIWYRLQGKRRSEVLGNESPQTAAVPILPEHKPLVPMTLAAKIPLNRQQNSYGVNILGYIYTEDGKGEEARGLLHALDIADVPVSAYSMDVHNPNRQKDLRGSKYEQGIQHAINLVVTNADMTEPTLELVGREKFVGRYNIALWDWEMPTFPETWHSYFGLYDEIWCNSHFAQLAFSSVSPIPVRRIRIPISIETSSISRTELGLPEDQFIVLFVFDANSIIERKNPFAVIDAFKQAFSEDEHRNKVKLVLKASNIKRHPEHETVIRQQLAKINGILLDDYLDRKDLNALIQHCDIYISLHRSEGYGLTIKEAMYLGRPVITTAYSGNMDFTNDYNSFLVPYTLQKLDKNYGPYQRGNLWAEPDTKHAAKMLRYCFENQSEAAKVGQRAAEFIQERYNSKTIGHLIAQIIKEITTKHQLVETLPDS